MADQTNHEDRLADRNLRMIGRRLQLPADPTPRQQAAWKQTSAAPRAVEHLHHPSIPERGVRFMRRHRFLTAATSAVAASIVLAVLLATPRGAVVEARTIFNSLRQTLFDGFEITFQNIGVKGVLIDGKVVVALRAAKKTGAATGAPTDPPRLEVESLYAEVRVRGEESDQQRAGLDLQAVLALDSQTQWAYVKMPGIPANILEEEPMAWLLVSLASRGLLLDLDGIPDLLDFNDGGSIALQMPTSPKADYEPAWGTGGENDLQELFMDLLYGRAGGEQIGRLVTLLAQTARDVRVVEIEPGVHVLTARDFTLEACDVDADEAAVLARLVLKIAYREGGGIDWVVVKNLGAYEGAVRLSPLGAEINPTLFDKARLIEPGATTVWDLSSVQTMLKQMMREDD